MFSHSWGISQFIAVKDRISRYVKPTKPVTQLPSTWHNKYSRYLLHGMHFATGSKFNCFTTTEVFLTLSLLTIVGTWTLLKTVSNIGDVYKNLFLYHWKVVHFSKQNCPAPHRPRWGSFKAGKKSNPNYPLGQKSLTPVGESQNFVRGWVGYASTVT